MKRASILTLAVLVILSAAAFAGYKGMRGPGPDMDRAGFMGHHGDKAGCHQGGGAGMMIAKFANELGLSTQQLDDIRNINFKFQQEMIDFRASLQKAKLSKRQEMMSDSPDKAKVLQYTKEMSTIKGQMAIRKVEHQFAVRNVLTPDQQAKLKQLRMNRPDGCRGMGKPGMGQGAPGMGPRGGRCGFGR